MTEWLLGFLERTKDHCVRWWWKKGDGRNRAGEYIRVGRKREREADDGGKRIRVLIRDKVKRIADEVADF